MTTSGEERQSLAYGDGMDGTAGLMTLQYGYVCLAVDSLPGRTHQSGPIIGLSSADLYRAHQCRWHRPRLRHRLLGKQIERSNEEQSQSGSSRGLSRQQKRAAKAEHADGVQALERTFLWLASAGFSAGLSRNCYNITV